MTVTETQISVAEARKLLLDLKGKECWSLKSGGAAGGSIVLSFGGKVRREHPVPNPTLSRTEREFEGEFTALVTCAWRLHRKGKVVASDSTPESLRNEAIQRLRGKRVTYSELYEATGDLHLHFSDGQMLELVADYSPADDDVDNWHIEFPASCLSQSIRGFLHLSTPTANE